MQEVLSNRICGTTCRQKFTTRRNDNEKTGPQAVRNVEVETERDSSDSKRVMSRRVKEDETTGKTSDISHISKEQS